MRRTLSGVVVLGMLAAAVAGATAGDGRSGHGLGHDAVVIGFRSAAGHDYTYSLRVNSAANFGCKSAAVTFALPRLDGTPAVAATHAGEQWLCRNGEHPVVDYREEDRGSVAVVVRYVPSSPKRAGRSPMVVEMKGGLGKSAADIASGPTCVNVGRIRQPVGCELPILTPTPSPTRVPGR